jgi:ABC-type uncharacterized transport system substrate-binding protein
MVLDFSISILILKKMAITISDRAYMMKKPYLALIAFLIPCSLLSHPHVFIDYTVNFVFDQNGLTGIEAKWIFDEMYSSMLIQDYDVDKDGRFSNSEIITTKQDAFSNLENYNYFVYITIDSKCFEVKSVENFFVDVRDNRVIYRFFIPCVVPTTLSYKKIEICMYDETYYVDLLPLDDDPVRFTNEGSIDYEVKVFEDTKESQDYGEIYPYSISLKFRGIE